MNQRNILERVIAFRRELHMYPEIGFKEFETRQRIKNLLMEFGIRQSQWTQIAKTGLIVDICGRAPAEGERKCVAFRADIDALSMNQENHDLQYRSKNNGVAHMCGHDGHTACLVGFVPYIMQNLDRIPQNKSIRLLFQPSEQGPDSGAKLMIQQGCLDRVDQVYGFHCAPRAPVGHFWCLQGPCMSEITIVKITLSGTGGHGSQAAKQKVAIWQGMNLYNKIQNYLNQVTSQKNGLFSGSLPVFTSGQRYNVVSKTAYMQGTLRSLQEGLKDIVISKISQFVEQSRAKGFQVELKSDQGFPILYNSPQQTRNLMKLAEKVFKKQNIGKGPLPCIASQDFSYYTQHRKGAYFFLSSARTTQIQHQHNPNYNFNDDLIQPATKFWYELAMDRLGVKNQ